jgi:hypothetical protein
VTGYIQASATFGPGEAGETTLISPPGAINMFIAKYETGGLVVWAKRAGGSNLAEGIGIGLDGVGNSYVTGDFTGSATFGPGEANETTLTSAGSFDVFVAKYSVGP